MTQADCVLSTPPTNTPVDTTRRGFLEGTAAALAASTAVNVAALATIRPAAAASDPIYAAIEAHKTARAVTAAAVGQIMLLERELQSNGRLQLSRRLPDERRRGDEIEAVLSGAHDAETDVACALVNVLPTTMTGAVALLRYAIEADVDGEGWPRGLYSDDGSKIRDWQYFLIANLAEVLPELSVSA